MLNNVFPLCVQAAVQVSSEMTLTNNTIATTFQSAANWIDDCQTWGLVVYS